MTVLYTLYFLLSFCICFMWNVFNLDVALGALGGPSCCDSDVSRTEGAYIRKGVSPPDTWHAVCNLCAMWKCVSYPRGLHDFLACTGNGISWGGAPVFELRQRSGQSWGGWGMAFALPRPLGTGVGKDECSQWTMTQSWLFVFEAKQKSIIFKEKRTTSTSC